MGLRDQLRRAMERSGLSLYAIAQGTGLPYGLLHHFARGKRDMRLDTASKVASYLGLKLVETRKKRG